MYVLPFPSPFWHINQLRSDSHKKVHQGWGGDRGDTELKDETAGANDAAAGDAWGAPATTEGWDATAPTGEGWGAPANGGGDAPADPWADSAGGVESKDKAGDDEGRKRKKYDDEEDEGKMTLDEYRAKSAPAESETIPKLELRKANEGASDLFEGARQLVKDVDADNYFVGKVDCLSLLLLPILTSPIAIQIGWWSKDPQGKQTIH